jgi:hypothetical protein
MNDMAARGPRRGISFGEMVVGVLFVAVALRALLMPTQSDTFWHLRTGADIVHSWQVPRADPYSFTASGWPWRNHEWLWQPLSYVCYRAGGMPLLVGCAALFVVAAMAVSYRLSVGPVMTRALLLAASLPLSMTVWAVRPHLVTLLAVPLLVSLLARERRWPIPLLFVVWANAHGGVALGGILLVVATGVAFARWRIRRAPEDRRRALALAVVLPLSGLACLVTPLGTGMLHFLSDSMARIGAVGISEWQPASPTAPFAVVFWIIALAFVVLVIKRRRALRGEGHASSWADWVTVGGALALMPLAFAAMRNVAPFLLLAVPAASRLLGPHAGLRLASRRPSAAAGGGEHPLINLGLLVAVAAAALALVVADYRRKPPDWMPIDGRALAAIRGCDGPLYNHYDEGGYLIWAVPDKPVFIDSRQDPYPLPHLLEALAVERGQAPYRPLFERWGIRCVFLANASPTVEALRRDGWVTRYRDDQWTVFSAAPR